MRKCQGDLKTSIILKGMNLGNNIRKLRLDKGWTQTELGEKVGVDQKVITSYERGVSKPPLDNLVKFATVFGISLDELAGKVAVRTKNQEEPKLHRNRRTAKIEKLFDQLPAVEQRALLKMVEATVQRKKAR